jgi:predicted phosphodiesterase
VKPEILRCLEKQYAESAEVRLPETVRVVILSDLHLGNGGRMDDFRRNAELVLAALKTRYLAEGYILVLNGDIEELQKFSLRSIREAWGEFYRIISCFERSSGLFRICGNHDHAMIARDPKAYLGLRLRINGIPIFILHGHQAAATWAWLNIPTGFLLRWIASPLGIRNYSVSRDSGKRFQVEKRIYEFSNRKRTISIIGHTHRPLFESLSRKDSLRFGIELLVRKLTDTNDPDERAILEDRIRKMKDQLAGVGERRGAENRNSLYNEAIVVPSLFNSGCAIGKRGFTCIEIDSGTLRLVHWFDSGRSSRYLSENGRVPERIGNTGFHRKVLKEDTLAYIYEKIRLLA